MIKAKKCKGGVWDDDDDEYYGLLNGEVCKADDGSCRLFKGECDREVVYIYRESEHAATQAALAAAEKALSCGIGQIEAFMGQVKIGSLNSGAERQLVAINDDFIKIANDALARLRALGKG